MVQLKQNPFISSKSKYGPPRSNNIWVYVVLCLGVIAFLVRLYWPSPPAPKNSPPPVTNSVVIPPAPKQIVQSVPVTNATIIPINPIPPISPINPITPSVDTVLAAQIELARLGYSSGSIDGKFGLQTRSALLAYQKEQELTPSGNLDTETKTNLLTSTPALTQYTITTNDLGRLLPLSTTWVGKSEQPRLDYETILELLGEKSFSHPQLIRDLNPNVNWNQLTAGARVTLPNVEYPPITKKASVIKISLANRLLEAFDAETNLLAHFPCSIGHIAEKRPVGELKIEVIIFNPNYTFNPAVFPESPEAQSVGHKLIIPPGPNNPVGMAWIGLNRPGYGIHGTPGPEQVGRTESHGCFRLANWNAVYLAHLSSVGMTVIVEP